MAVHRNKSVSAHSFAMVPRSEVPRSRFKMEKALKTTFNASYLIPIFCEEVLPGDSFDVRMTAFCRLATPVVPVMDNLSLETFFFFVPNRILWDNWNRFMGEQDDPGDSVSFVIPQVVSPVGGYQTGQIGDYYGLPTEGQVGVAETFSHSALPFRGYNKIYNDWFRDQNLIDSLAVPRDDGPDTVTDYNLARRAKRKDYFTSALPFLQKGAPVTIPLGTSAPVTITGRLTGATYPTFTDSVSGLALSSLMNANAGVEGVGVLTNAGGTGRLVWADPALTGVADLSAATAATVNQFRQAFAIQKLLERDARGGTRYTEITQAHFGVRSPDSRLQRPEYLGGGRTSIQISAVPQTSGTGDTSDTPQGNLSAFGTALANGHSFSSAFTEHGYIHGLCMVRADVTYQQGLRRHWSRSSKYDFYWPAFAMLGEQSILNKEIFCDGTATDELTFAYQERWGELRYIPSEITGLFRSTAALSIDIWHFAQQFAGVPGFSQAFIEDATFETLERALAVGEAAGGQQLLMDAFFAVTAARPLPLYSVPGLIDHF